MVFLSLSVCELVDLGQELLRALIVLVVLGLEVGLAVGEGLGLDVDLPLGDAWWSIPGSSSVRDNWTTSRWRGG